MADVVPDILEESGLTQTRAGGYEKRRRYLVRNFSSSEAAAREYEALQAVPAMLSAHDTIPVPMFVDEKSAEAVSAEEIYVEVVYRSEIGEGGYRTPDVGDEPQLRVSGTLITAQTNQDKDDNPLKLDEYTGPGVGIKENTATITYQVPQFTFGLRVRQTERPDDIAKQLVGKVNQSSWRGFSARQILCTAVIGSSPDGGSTWDNQYEFAFKEDTWDETIFQRYPETGEIPANPTVANGGKKIFRIYKEVDYNTVAASAS